MQQQQNLDHVVDGIADTADAIGGLAATLAALAPGDSETRDRAIAWLAERLDGYASDMVALTSKLQELANAGRQ